jgi:hypothetical protein
MGMQLGCVLVAAALCVSVPVAAVGAEADVGGAPRRVEVERVDVLRGQVSLEAAGGLVIPLPDGDYAGPGARLRVSSNRIDEVHPDAAPGATGGAAPVHPRVETAWVREGRLFLANRSGAQLELPSGPYTSPRGVTLEIDGRRIRSIRAPETLLHAPRATATTPRWLRILALLLPFRTHQPPVVVH